MKYLWFFPVVFLSCFTSEAQLGKFPIGIVFNGTDAFQIEAPKGWVLDNKSGVNERLHCVLYLEDYTWVSSPVAMYARIDSGPGVNIKSFLEYELKVLPMRDSTFAYKLKDSMLVEEKYPTVIYDFSYIATSNYERIAYIEVPESVCIVVFAANSEEDFDRYAGFIYDVLKKVKRRTEFKNGKPN